jgi:transcription elongation factor GreA
MNSSEPVVNSNTQEIARSGLIRLTAVGLADAKEELGRIRSNELPDIQSQLEAARDGGWDPLENTDLAIARDEWRAVETRIAKLETLIAEATVIECPECPEVVSFGAHVTVEIDGKPSSYQIVGPAEVNSRAGKISDVSPLGKVLIGAHVGDIVTVVAPMGSYTATLIAIE